MPAETERPTGEYTLETMGRRRSNMEVWLLWAHLGPLPQPETLDMGCAGSCRGSGGPQLWVHAALHGNRLGPQHA